MLHRLPGALLLIASSSITLAACAAGGGSSGDDDDDVSVDAREIDTASPDASSPDALQPDAMPPDGMAPDAMVPLTGETCGMPEVITIAGGLGNATVTGTTVGYTNHYMPPTACTSTYLQDGPDHVYEIAVPAGARLDAVVTPASGYDAGIYLIGAPATSCDASPIVCLAGLDAGFSGGAESVRYNNTTGAAHSVFIVIDGTAATGGTFSLTATVATIPPTPPGDTCQLAETVTLTNGMATVTGTTVAAQEYANNYLPPSGCTTGEGNDHVHVVTVQAGHRLGATVSTQVSAFDATLYLIAGPAAMCDATPIACLAGVDDSGGGGSESIMYDNTTGAPVDVMIVVDGYADDDEGAYSLAVTVNTIPMNPTGDACTNAEAITLTGGAATLSGTNTTAAGYTDNYAPTSGCARGEGNDRVYSVTVPPGELLVAAAHPSGFDATLYAIAGPATACSASPIVCLGGSDDGGTDDPEAITYENETASPVEVFLVVDAYSETGQGTFDLVVSMGPTGRGDTCQTAEPITLTGGSATVVGSTSEPHGYTASYAPPAACTSTYEAIGRDHAHVVSVPAGATITATMTPIDWDGSVYLVAGPAASCDATPITCLAGTDSGSSSGAETVMHTNSTGASVDVMVVVDSYSLSHGGPYSLAVDVTVAP